MGADLAGNAARQAAAAAGAASFPQTGASLNLGPGNNGTAMPILLGKGQVGGRGFMHSSPRSLAKGNAGSVGIAYNGTAPAATVEAGQTDNPGVPGMAAT